MGLINPDRGSISGSEEEGGFFWDCPLFKKYGLLLAKNKNKWALRWIGFCIGPVGCPCFVLEGLVLEAARDTLQLIAHSKEKRDASSLWLLIGNLFQLGIHQIRGCGTGCRHSHWFRCVAK